MEISQEFKITQVWSKPQRSQVTAFDQQYVCAECGKGYKWMDNLRRHQRLECGKKPSYNCSVCPKAFYRHYEWKNHIILKHPEISSRASGAYQER